MTELLSGEDLGSHVTRKSLTVGTQNNKSQGRACIISKDTETLPSLPFWIGKMNILQLTFNWLTILHTHIEISGYDLDYNWKNSKLYWKVLDSQETWVLSLVFLLVRGSWVSELHLSFFTCEMRELDAIYKVSLDFFPSPNIYLANISRQI